MSECRRAAMDIKIVAKAKKKKKGPMKPRVVIPFNTGSRRHPDETKYTKKDRKKDKQDLRRYSEERRGDL